MPDGSVKSGFGKAISTGKVRVWAEASRATRRTVPSISVPLTSRTLAVDADRDVAEIDAR